MIMTTSSTQRNGSESPCRGNSEMAASKTSLCQITAQRAADLHTHVAVANKVQTLDGRWLSIDGRILFKATLAASETYNTALERATSTTVLVSDSPNGRTRTRGNGRSEKSSASIPH
jgi:hypothetical protein